MVGGPFGGGDSQILLVLMVAGLAGPPLAQICGPSDLDNARMKVSRRWL